MKAHIAVTLCMSICQHVSQHDDVGDEVWGRGTEKKRKRWGSVTKIGRKDGEKKDERGS